MEAIKDENNLKERDEKENSLEYYKDALKGNKGNALKWLDFDTLPKVRFEDNKKNEEDEIIKYIFLCYFLRNEIGLNSEVQRISEFLNKEDLKELALEVLIRWKDNGAESKKKWILSFAAVYGDYRVIDILKKDIEEFAKNSRGIGQGES